LTWKRLPLAEVDNMGALFRGNHARCKNDLMEVCENFTVALGD